MTCDRSTPGFWRCPTHKFKLDRALVPEESKEVKQFENKQLSGKYKAHISGAHYKHKKTKIAAGGKAIQYSFITSWKGKADDLPWIKISHTVPNIAHNADVIANLSKEKSLLEEKIDAGQTALADRLRERDELDQGISQLEGEIKTSNENLSVYREIALNSVEYHLNENSRLINKLNQQLKISQKSRKQTRQKVIDIENRLKIKAAHKQRFAAAIYQQLEIVQSLRKFAELGMSEAPDEDDPVQQEVVNTCRLFIKVYDERFHDLESECKKDLKELQP